MAMTAAAAACTAEKTPKPNIILIYADDMGIGDIGCYGQQHIHTPYLDRMASEGMVFTNHYSGSAVSSPSRSCLMTGQHSGHTYIRGNYEVASQDVMEEGQLPLPPGQMTIASVLKSAGYTTGAFGKWGMGSSVSYGNPNDQGFDTFYGYIDQRHAHSHYPTFLICDGKKVEINNPYIPRNEQIPEDSPTEAFEKYKGNEYSLDLMVDRAKSFICDNSDKPFFVYLPVIVPHRALQVPDEELDQYDFDETPYYGNNKFLPHLKPHAAYAGMISRMDRKVGEIIDLLKELGIDENTMVLFSSDNGPCDIGGGDCAFFNSAMGLTGRKRSLHEGGIRAPLVVRWPGKIKAGSTSDILCSQYDFLATFAQIAGAKLPSATDGISILPTLTGKRQKKVHDFLYWEYEEVGGQQAVRMGTYKAYREGTKADHNKTWSLYDLSSDPAELDDIADANPEIVEAMAKIAAEEHLPSIVKAWNFVDGNDLAMDIPETIDVAEGADGRLVVNLPSGKSLPFEEVMVWSRGRRTLKLSSSNPYAQRACHIAGIYKSKLEICNE